ncbi:MAG: SIMPL domain-containing protein [Thermoleophilia bacterium]|nr:SIMPL domain-containing protein [Thermoleophilia bacterium]
MTHSKRSTGRLIAAVLVGLTIILAGTLAGCSQEQPAAQAESPEAQGANTIVVTGTGTVTTAPDEATIQIGVETDGKTAAAALDANSKETQKVLDRLKAEGISQDKIETAGVTVYPNRYYDSATGQEKTTGYRAQNTVSVRITDFAQIGQVFAAASDAGADNINGPAWQLREDSSAVAKALSKALANAQLKAEAIAQDQGLRLGEVVSISENQSYNWFPGMDARAYAGAQETGSVTPPPIIPQNIQVTASVTVVYRIVR